MLSITLRQDTTALRSLAEEVAHGEVGELDTRLQNHTCVTITEGEFQLVACLWHQSEVEIYRSVVTVWLWLEVDLFRVEVSHLTDFLISHLEGIHGEEVARLEFQLTADDFFIHTRVTINLDFVDGCLNSFDDADFEVDGVAIHIHFNRFHLNEDITLVVVGILHSVVIFFQTLLDVLLVIDIAFFHAEHSVQSFRIVDGVSHPVDVANIVALSFIDVDIHIHEVLACRHHAVCHNLCVAITELVIFLNDALFVLGIFLFNELLGLEQTLETLFVGFLQQTAREEVTMKLSSLDVVITRNVNLVDLHLLLFVDVHINNHLVLLVQVVALDDFSLGILETFIIEIALDDNLGTVHHVRRNLNTLHDTDFLFQVLLLALSHTIDVDFRHTRSRSENDFQVETVVLNLFSFDADRRKESMLPIALHSSGNFITRKCHLFSNGES